MKNIKPRDVNHNLTPILPSWHGSINDSRFVEKYDFHIFAALVTGFFFIMLLLGLTTLVTTLLIKHRKDKEQIADLKNTFESPPFPPQ